MIFKFLPKKRNTDKTTKAFPKLWPQIRLPLFMLCLYLLKNQYDQVEIPKQRTMLLSTYQKAETKLALGQKLLASQTKNFDLELIPQISTNIAKEITRYNFDTKEDITNTESLLKIKGIGPAKAKVINRYLIMQ